MQVFSGRAVTHMHAMMKKVLDYVYPPRCPVCDEVLPPGIDICEGCTKEAVTITEPICKKCGKPIESREREYCSDCLEKQHVYRQGRAVFLYRAGIKKSMYRFKYSNRREYAQFYARYAARLHGSWVLKNRIEVIVPIPMYPGKWRRRGYNQAEIFARALGKELGIPVDAGIVKRIRNTVPQKALNDKERQRNLKNAFQLAPNIVKYSQILLVDDIYTTGSTMDAVAAVLLSGGAQNIYYICISIGSGF